VVSTTTRSLYPRERPGSHCVGGWVSLGAGVGGCGRFCPHRHDDLRELSKYSSDLEVVQEVRR
jgi:hypothetical protein